MPTYVMHIVFGALSIAAGFVALYSAKGASVHRKAGILFVYVMLLMTTTGMSMAVLRGAAPAVNVPAALLTSYLVITALTTVRASLSGVRWLNLAALLVALGVCVTTMWLGAEAIAAGGVRKGIPAFPFLMFGVVSFLAVVGDIRVLRSGPRTGAPRIGRHLWRMSFALFIATMSFFIGQAKVFPKEYRIYPLLALPVLAVLITMFYWMWRTRTKSGLRGMTFGGGRRERRPVDVPLTFRSV